MTLTPKAASSRRPTAGGSAGKSSPAVLHLHLRDLALGQVVSRISLEPSVSSVSRTVLTLTEPAIGAGP